MTQNTKTEDSTPTLISATQAAQLLRQPYHDGLRILEKAGVKPTYILKVGNQNRPMYDSREVIKLREARDQAIAAKRAAKASGAQNVAEDTRMPKYPDLVNEVRAISRKIDRLLEIWAPRENTASSANTQTAAEPNGQFSPLASQIDFDDDRHSS